MNENEGFGLSSGTVKQAKEDPDKQVLIGLVGK